MMTLREWIYDRRARAGKARRPKRVILSCDQLEGRVTPAHHGFAHHAIGAVVSSTLAASHSTSTSTSGTTTSGTTTSGTTTSNSALTTALHTLQNDVLKIESASSTTVGQLATIRLAFQTLQSDGLSPSSQSALSSFENSLVTTLASGTTLTGNSTLLSQFEALYTSSPTTQQTTDLTNAYNALAAAVTSANITTADINTINTDYSAVLTAEGSTSTATYPYFNLVTGQGSGLGHGPGGGGCAGG
jgi:mucin-2